jgi:hypothetical protein
VYTRNTFRFGALTPLWCFRRLLHTKYYNLIQNLYLQYTYPPGWRWQCYETLLGRVPPYNLDVWKKTWDDICKMQGLCEVRVDFYLTSVAADFIEDWLFSPLEGLGDSINVEVRANWCFGNSGKDWPFKRRTRMFRHEDIDGSFRLEPEAVSPHSVGI